jgi:hypothetical protein
MKTRLYAAMLVAPVLFSAAACTDLVEEPLRDIAPDKFFKNEGEVLAALAGVYAQLRTLQDDYYNVSQVSSDEHIVPTRGQDWFDNGRWLELDKQTWAPNSPSGLTDMNGAWVNPFIGVVRANALMDNIEGVTLASKDTLKAEIRTLRAVYYYVLMDMFGGVPLVTNTELIARPKASRREVFDFIEAELKEVRTILPRTRSSGQHGRITKGVADAILANMYLNAAVFTKDAGIDAVGYNSCNTVQIGGASACQLAINFSDSVLNSGAYTLAANWRQNFTADNETSPELILVVKNLNVADLGLNFVMRALHYNQISPTPWNGFATIAEVYNAFDANDQRREIFLVGPQFNLDDGRPINDRAGNRLSYTTTIANERNAGEHEGARLIKWPRDPAHLNEHHGNDFALFRLAEIYLIKAEAQLAMGSQLGLPLVNALRARVFEPDEPIIGVLTQDIILQERLFELAGEAKRRQDLIRHGKFTSPWQFKLQTAAHRVLMPIPQSQLDANPRLTQNAGY